MEPPPTTTVESRWWYVVAATPVAFVLSWVVGLLFVAWILLGFGFGVPRAAGLFFFVAVVVFAFFALFVTALLVLFPVAIYLDAEAVTDANLDWRPDSTLYALVAAVTALATGFTLSIPVAVYYLWKRHEHVGVP